MLLDGSPLEVWLFDNLFLSSGVVFGGGLCPVKSGWPPYEPFFFLLSIVGCVHPQCLSHILLTQMLDVFDFFAILIYFVKKKTDPFFFLQQLLSCSSCLLLFARIEFFFLRQERLSNNFSEIIVALWNAAIFIHVNRCAWRMEFVALAHANACCRWYIRTCAPFRLTPFHACQV
jgi:hypothetical protein